MKLTGARIQSFVAGYVARPDPKLRAVLVYGPDTGLVRERAAAISQPTLLVWGRDDPVIPVRLGALAARTLQRAKLVVLPTGHVPFAEDPDAFLLEVEPFLAQVNK